MNRTLIYTCCDKKYSHFIPLFCAALLYSNTNIDIEIGVNCNALTDREESALLYLRNMFPNSKILIKYNFFEVDYSKKNIEQASIFGKRMMINTVRFVTEPVIKNEYTYISDIDIISFDENFYNIHASLLQKHNMIYDNILRPNTNRLSGLHFIKTSEYYPIDITGINTVKNDEEVLKDITERKTVINKDLTYRPVHGIHMSLNRPDVGGNEHCLHWGAKNYKDSWLDFIKTDIYQEVSKSFDPMIISLIKMLNEYYKNLKS